MSLPQNFREVGDDLSTGLKQLPRAAVITPSFVGLLACIGLAWLNRFQVHGVDHAVSISQAWVLPLTGYAGFESVLRRSRLDATLRGVSRHGADGRRLWLGAAFAFMVWLALTGAAFAAVAVLVSRGGSRDAALSAWLGCWGGAAYAAWFALASDVGARGQGRKWFLLLDWLLGSISFLAWIGPRAHLRNLVGGEPPLGLSSSASFVLLLGSGLLALSVGFRRAPR